MLDRFIRGIRTMELEDKVFHGGLLGIAASMFFPWMTGGVYRDTAIWENGLSFRTGLIGHAVLLLILLILFVTFSPMLGGPIIVRKSSRALARLSAAATMSILLVAAFTVLVRTTFEIPGTEVRFGIYIASMLSLLSTFYAYLAVREQQMHQVHDLFHHPDEVTSVRAKVPEVEREHVPPPPPPPPPPPLEDHPPFTRTA